MGLMAFAVACGDDDGTGTSGMGDMAVDMPAADAGFIRVWHLADGAGDVDVFVNGAATLEGFGFEANTDYIELPAGSYDVAVAPAGMGIGAAVITVDGFALAAGERWTLIAAQTDADPAAAGALSILPVLESATAPGSDEVEFQIFHAAYAVPGAVDVHNASDPLLGEIAAGVAQGSVAPMTVTVPNGAYAIGLDVDDDDTVDLVTENPIDQPPGGTRVLVGAISKAEGDEVETEIVFLVGDGANIHDETELGAAEFGTVRFWHLADEAGDVDIFVGGTAIATGVGFEVNTAFAPFLAGDLDIAIAPAGMGAGAAVISANLPLGEGENYTVIAAQLDADETMASSFAALPILEDLSPLLASQVNVRVFHAAYGVPDPVEVHAIDGDTNPEVVDNLMQGTAAAMAVAVPREDALTVGLDLDDDGTPDVQTEDALGPFPDGIRFVTVGAITKLVMEGGELEEETEIVFLPGDGAMIHDETELVPFEG
ncbi:MAG: DUF4397 domain-containing protein [Myxococcota bacterium]